MFSQRFLVAALMLAAATAAHAQGNPEAGKNKVFQCQGCHGIPGWKTAFPEVYSVPKLGGQRAAYLVTAMKSYKTGERDFQTMRSIVADLSDQDMADIAAYYERQGAGITAAAPAPAGQKK